MLRVLIAGGCGIIAGMFVGFFVWFIREPDRLMWVGLLAAGFAGGVAGALLYRGSAKGSGHLPPGVVR
jgi:hypothetical protein